MTTTASEAQWVEVDSISEGWVDFDDPNGAAVMTWQTARHLADVARNADSGSATHMGRRFDREVLAAVVRAIDAAPKCRRIVDGRSECGRPSDPTSAAGWCRSCQRSN